MLKNILITASLLASQSSWAFSSGFKVSCIDDIAAQTITAKITDLGDQSAYVKITSPHRATRFYPSSMVRFSLHRGEIEMAMLAPNRRYVEESLFVEEFVFTRGWGYGTYMDRGDSRPVNCRRLSH